MPGRESIKPRRHRAVRVLRRDNVSVRATASRKNRSSGEEHVRAPNDHCVVAVCTVQQCRASCSCKLPLAQTLNCCACSSTMEAILPQTDDAPAAAVAEPSTSTMPTDAAASAAAVTPAPASVQLAAVQPARDAPTAAAAPAPASTITIAPAVAVGTPPATPFPTTGVVLFAGAAAHSLAGRAGPTQTYDGVAEQNLMSFHVIASLSSIKVRYAYTCLS